MGTLTTSHKERIMRKKLSEEEIGSLLFEEFCRPIGVITKKTQKELIKTKVAIAGAGGVGAIHALTLARSGVSNFHIADMDTYGVENTSRQFGAFSDTIGQNKAEVVAKETRRIHAKISIKTFSEINPDNVKEFLEGCDFYIDGMEFFEFDTRRLLFNTARKMGITALTVAPLGFGNGILAFSPEGMSFDQYFGIRDNMDYSEKLARFIAGIAPCGFHTSYIDKKTVSITEKRGPAVASACASAAGWMGTLVSAIAAKEKVKYAPWFTNVDMKRNKFSHNIMMFGSYCPKFQILWRVVKMMLNKKIIEESGGAKEKALMLLKHGIRV